MYVLTDEDAFMILNRKFSDLRQHDLIDIAYNDERFPAIVVSIDYSLRTFRILPLKKDTIRLVLASIPRFEPIDVALPDNPKEVRPMWNVVGK